jgi:hypothetical protein
MRDRRIEFTGRLLYVWEMQLMGNENSETWWKKLLNPIVVIAITILLSVLLLIGAAVVDWDRGHVLTAMSNSSYARGLITYLFAVVTIGTAVVLVVYALTGMEDEKNERHFQRGKEILSLLLGLFGTIVGFYFGSELSARPEAPLQLQPPRLSAAAAAPGDMFSFMSVVTGGRQPYRFGAAVGNDKPEPIEPVESSGWIIKELTVPQTTGEGDLSIVVTVRDADGHELQQSIKLLVKSRQ